MSASQHAVVTSALAAEAKEPTLDPGLREGWLGGPTPRYFLTRFVFLRGLGFIYSVAFLILIEQWRGLFGSRGILPAARFLERIRGRLDFFDLPTIFVLDASDATLGRCAVLGLALSVAVMLGVENAFVMAAL